MFSLSGIRKLNASKAYTERFEKRRADEDDARSAEEDEAEDEAQRVCLQTSAAMIEISAAVEGPSIRYFSFVAGFCAAGKNYIEAKAKAAELGIVPDHLK